jgi:hypothetical protein
MSRMWLRWIRRPELALFGLVFGAFAYFYQAGGWNQNSRFDLTRAIVEDHSVKLDRFVNNTGDYAQRGEHAYCDKAPAVSLAGSLPYLAVHAVTGSKRPDREELSWASWLSTVFAVALPSALGVVALTLLLAALGIRPGARFALAAAWGLATLAFPYSTLYYGHQLVAALLITAFSMQVRMARAVTAPTIARLIAVGALLAWAVAAEYPAALAVVVLAAYALRSLGLRRCLWIALGGLGPALVLAWYHDAGFGAPWHLPYEFAVQSAQREGLLGLGAPRLDVLLHITLWPYRGLFFSAPWLLLAVPGAVRLWRRGGPRETAVSAAIALLLLWMNMSYLVWDGGRAFGPRHLVPAIPFLVVLVGGLVVEPAVRSRLVMGIALAALAWSAFVMLAGTAVRPEVDFRIPHPVGDFLLPHFVHGDLATSSQSIDDLYTDTAGTRYAWNLGQKLGLTGLASLIPLVAWCAGMTVLLVRMIQSRHGMATEVVRDRTGDAAGRRDRDGGLA